MGSPSLLNAASIVVTTPSVESFSSTFFTWSGLSSALETRLLLPNDAKERSVPAETTEYKVSTIRKPSLGVGAGTSTSRMLPSSTMR